MRRLQSTATLAAILATTLAVGAAVVGHGLVAPALLAQTELFDANLAHASSRVVTERAANLALLAGAIAALLTPYWQDKKNGLTLALVALVAAVLDRVLVIPQMHDTWRFVDFITARPAEELASAERWQIAHWSLAATYAICSGALGIRGIKLGERRAVARAMGQHNRSSEPATGPAIEASPARPSIGQHPAASEATQAAPRTSKGGSARPSYPSLTVAPPVGRRRQMDATPPPSSEMAPHNSM